MLAVCMGKLVYLKQIRADVRGTVPNLIRGEDKAAAGCQFVNHTLGIVDFMLGKLIRNGKYVREAVGLQHCPLGPKLGEGLRPAAYPR